MYSSRDRASVNVADMPQTQALEMAVSAMLNMDYKQANGTKTSTFEFGSICVSRDDNIGIDVSDANMIMTKRQGRLWRQLFVAGLRIKRNFAPIATLRSSGADDGCNTAAYHVSYYILFLLVSRFLLLRLTKTGTPNRNIIVIDAENQRHQHVNSH